MRFASVLIALFTCTCFAQDDSNFRAGEIREFSLDHATAKEVVTILNEQFLDQVKFSANANTNIIYGRIPGSLVPELEKFLDQLEVAAAERDIQREREAQRLEEEIRMRQEEERHERYKKSELALKIFYLKYVGVEDLLAAIAELRFDDGKLSVAAEPRTNSILARGSASSLKELETLLQQLDRPVENENVPSANRSVDQQITASQVQLQKLMSVLDPRHPAVVQLRKKIAMTSGFNTRDKSTAVASAVKNQSRQVESSIRKEYEAAEQSAAQIAQQWRELNERPEKDAKKLSALKSELQIHVQVAFKLRQSLKQLEIEGAAEQLRLIRERLQRREEIATQIVERRVKDLLTSEDVAWVATTDTVKVPSAASLEAGLASSGNTTDGPVQIEALDGGIVILRGKKEDVESVMNVIETVEQAGAGRGISMVRGVVTNFDAEKKLVTVSIGNDDGIKKGDVLGVWRDGKPIGRLSIVSIQPDSSLGKVLQEVKERKISRGDDVGVMFQAKEVLPGVPAQ